MLGNEYGKTLPFIFFAYCLSDDWVCSTIKQELGELEKVETQKNRMTELHDELQTIHSEEKQEHVSLTPFEQCIFNAGHIIMHSLVSVCLSACLYHVKGKVFPYSLPSVGPGADPGVQAVSPQVT